MPTLYFSSHHEPLVKALCTRSVSPDLIELFPNYRDLMLFAAMVGKKYSRIAERQGSGGEVESAYFKSPSFNREGVVYLIGLLEEKDPTVLKGGALECWKLFESYCNGGMELISEWLEKSETPEDYQSVLQEKLQEFARKSKKVPVKVKRPKLKFIE